MNERGFPVSSDPRNCDVRHSGATMGSAISHQLSHLWKRKPMSTIVTICIDLAKNVFAVHGVDATGKLALIRTNVARTKLLEAALRPFVSKHPQATSAATTLNRNFRQLAV